jgi:hypothetical protein
VLSVISKHAGKSVFCTEPMVSQGGTVEEQLAGSQPA